MLCRMNKEIFIKLHNVTKRFKQNHVLDNVNLSIYHGEILGIIGASGAGKTTLLRRLVGFIGSDGGNVFIRLKPILRRDAKLFNHFEPLTPRFNRLFGFATQEGSFYSHLTVKENLFYFANLYDLKGGEVKKNTYLLLKLVGLYDERNVLAKDLSEGMQKRLDIACAMIHNPKLLILDEPTADLDPNLRKQILSLIRKINENGVTVVISSHFFDDVANLCHRVAILHNNKISMVGTVEELKTSLTQSEKIYLETFPGNYDAILNMLAGKNIYIQNITQDRNALVFSVPKAELILPALLHSIKEINETVVNIDIIRPTLNDILTHMEQQNV